MLHESKIRYKYNELLREHVGDGGNLYLYWKGRVALYALLKAMGISNGDEVILPAFTCVVVPNAILYLGATPVYVDIDEDTFNPSLENIEKAITSKTKLIICQNTFGLSTEIDLIVKLAQQKSLAQKTWIYTIEDCTHGFGGYYNEIPNGSWCDAAFYSTQWNKPFSTGIGGIALVNHFAIAERLEVINKQLIKPSLKDELVLSILIFTRKYLLTAFNYWLFLKVYRWLSKHKLVIGSSSGEELSEIKMPSNYFKAMSDVQIIEGIKNIQKLPSVLTLRRQNAQWYTDILKKNNKKHVADHWHKNHSFLKYPILVKNRMEFMQKAEAAKIELGDWFNSPLHPIPEKDLHKWGMNAKEFPVAVEVSRHIVNLPTGIKKHKKIEEFISRNLEDIY